VFVIRADRYAVILPLFWIFDKNRSCSPGRTGNQKPGFCLNICRKNRHFLEETGFLALVLYLQQFYIYETEHSQLQEAPNQLQLIIEYRTDRLRIEPDYDIDRVH
jgi:hypothetical protein